MPSRSVLSNSKSRQENEAARIEARSQVFLKADEVDDFEDFIAKIVDDDIQRQGYLMQHTQIGINLIHITKEFPPLLFATICVKKILK